MQLGSKWLWQRKHIISNSAADSAYQHHVKIQTKKCMFICSYVFMSIGCDLLISEHLELYSLNFFPVSIPLFDKGKIRHSLVSKNKALSVVICIHAQSYPTLCDAVDCSPPGSVVHGIFLARTLEWVAIFSSRDLPNPGMNTHDLSYLYCRWCLYHWATRKALKLYEMWGNTLK